MKKHSLPLAKSFHYHHHTQKTTHVIHRVAMFFFCNTFLITWRSRAPVSFCTFCWRFPSSSPLLTKSARIIIATAATAAAAPPIKISRGCDRHRDIGFLIAYLLFGGVGGIEVRHTTGGYFLFFVFFFRIGGGDGPVSTIKGRPMTWNRLIYFLLIKHKKQERFRELQFRSNFFCIFSMLPKVI